jgi:IrrE N-terminal-like domain
MTVRYIPEAVFEARATELWQQHGLEPAFDVEDLADRLGLGVLWEEVPDVEGAIVLGQLDPNEARIVLNEGHLADLEANGGRLRRYTIGHEIGHWLFHADAARSGTLSLVSGGRVWCRGGSKDPAERQAEMFSARLLMPKERLRDAVPKTSWRGWRPVYVLAETFAVSPTAMMIRLDELRWAHRDELGDPVSGSAPVPGQAELFG